MPPLNHKTDLKHTQTVYLIRVREQNRDSFTDGYHEVGRELCGSLQAAFIAALEPFDSHPKVRRMSIGPYTFYEPHEEDEEYLQVTISEQRVYDE